MSHGQPRLHRDGVEPKMANERQRLVRLCGSITGDFAAAEDLAQETLLEAHRNADKLRDPAARQAWLSGIARNVCRRWARARGRELAFFAGRPSGSEDDSPGAGLADDLDLELELERSELALLLDRALALLPDETRLALIHRYVEEEPQARIAERLGLSQGAVAMRLSRGKLALRHILATDLHDDAVALGLAPESVECWQPTRIWCTLCGVERLHGHFDPLTGEVMLRCPGCFPTYDLYHMRSTGGVELFTGVLGIRAAYRRVMAASTNFYDAVLANETVPCPACGRAATVHRRLPDDVLPRRRESRGVHTHCSHCGTVTYSSLGGLIQGIPAVWAFIEEQVQVRSLPEREISVDGRPALVSRLESLSSGMHLDVVIDAERLTPLRIYRNGMPLARA